MGLQWWDCAFWIVRVVLPPKQYSLFPSVTRSRYLVVRLTTVNRLSKLIYFVDTATSNYTSAYALLSTVDFYP